MRQWQCFSRGKGCLVNLFPTAQVQLDALELFSLTTDCPLRFVH